MGMPKCTGKSLWGLIPTQRSSGKWVKPGVRDSPPSGRRHQLFLSNVKWSSLKTHMQVSLYGLNQLYLRIYMYMKLTTCLQWQLMKREGTNLNDSRWGFKGGCEVGRRKGYCPLTLFETLALLTPCCFIFSTRL